MTFAPTVLELLERARTDLRLGLAVVLRAGGHDCVIWAAEVLRPEVWRDIQALQGDTILSVTEHRARILKAHAYDGDIARIRVTEPRDVAWVHAIADPSRDLATPLKGPFQTARGDDATAQRAALNLAKSAELLPAAVSVETTDFGFALKNNLTILPLNQVIAALRAPQIMTQVSAARVPLAASDAGKVHVFRPETGGAEHYAIEIGQPKRDEPVLARLHSACFTGDVLGSLKCDCGPQLRAALAQMGAAGQGVLLYLNQEGRGIGLANKMRAYALQDQGFDTVEANHRLGFEDDERDFRTGAEILHRLGFSKVRLLTNNPAKIARMRAGGIEVVERVALKVGKTPENAAYLATKATKSGHLL